MTFHRPHPNQISRGPASNRELELEQVNQALRDELSTVFRRDKLSWLNETTRIFAALRKPAWN